MKTKLFRLLLVFSASICVLVSCGKKTESTSEGKPTQEPKVTAEPGETVAPEPTPMPAEEFIELSEDEITELYAKSLENKTGHYINDHLFYTKFIVEYYKYIGMEELEVPVIICYQAEDAEKRFGGEWEYIPNIKVETEEKKELFGMYWDYFYDIFSVTEFTFGVDKEEQNWLKGKLTIAEVDDELSLENGRIYIINDYSVESAYANEGGRVSWFPPLRPFAEYMRWLRHYGHYTVDEYEDEDGTKHLYIDYRHLYSY